MPDSSQNPSSTLIAADAAQLAERAPYHPGRVTVSTEFDGRGVRIRQLALGEAATLQEHIAPKPITVLVLEGAVRFAVGGQRHRLTGGALVFVDANVPHEVVAERPSRILITLIG